MRSFDCWRIVAAVFFVGIASAEARAGGAGGTAGSHAHLPQARAASTEVLVSEGGGQYEVTLNPAIITSLFVPEKIVRVLASDQVDFTIRRMGNAVAIRPRRADTRLHANLVIVTKTLRITVLLRVSKDISAAQGQVTFRKAKEARQLQRRIDREVNQRLAAARAEMPRQIERAIAERVFARFTSRRLGAIDRNDDNIIVKVPRVVRVGDDAYVFVEIQNRSHEPYRLARVAVESRGDNVAGPVVFAGKAVTGPVLGTIAPADHARAMVVVEGTDKIPGRDVAVVVTEAGGRRYVRVARVAIK